mmetsp:Transcript_19994/g.63274  ORF Transcript_19994/g.63274 Transcript_19994/m.63274 type:complete len:238 (+) Transcript_19994:250-963(+)
MTQPQTSMSWRMQTSMPPARNCCSVCQCLFNSPSGKTAIWPPLLTWSSTMRKASAMRSLSTEKSPWVVERVNGTGKWPTARAMRPSKGKRKWARAMRVFVSPTRLEGRKAQMSGVSSHETWFAATKTWRPRWPAHPSSSNPETLMRIQKHTRKARRHNTEVNRPTKRPCRRRPSVEQQQEQQTSVTAVYSHTGSVTSRNTQRKAARAGHASKACMQPCVRSVPPSNNEGLCNGPRDP